MVISKILKPEPEPELLFILIRNPDFYSYSFDSKPGREFNI
jgi:hypothetical protein